MLISRYAPDNWSVRLMRYGGASMLFLGTIGGLMIIALAVIPVDSLLEASIVFRLLIGLVGAVFLVDASVTGAGFMITACDISLDQFSALTVHYPLLFRKSLSIDLVRTARRTRASVPRYHLKPSAALNRSATAFEIRGLPFIHRLAGLHYRAGFKPILVVTEFHQNHELLIVELSKMIDTGSNDDSSAGLIVHPRPK